MRVLLISNSTNYGEDYLQHAKPKIKQFLGDKSYLGLFIPFAAVTISYEDYENKVKRAFEDIGYDIISIHRLKDFRKAVEKAELIIVGGGNTFRLLQLLQEYELVSIIRKRVLEDKVPYIGWSAGANVACPTISTTNDMPIVEPQTFKAIGIVNFQINPHYTNKTIEGHAGETRDERLLEYIELNQDKFVVALPEGTALMISDNNIKILGKKKIKIFKKGILPYEMSPNSNLNFLL